jgi:hypothetical protein
MQAHHLETSDNCNNCDFSHPVTSILNAPAKSYYRDINECLNFSLAKECVVDSSDRRNTILK